MAAPVSRGAAGQKPKAEPTGFFIDGYAEGTPIHWLIDTGCTSTIINYKNYMMIPEERRPELKEHPTVLVTADDQPLKLYGQAVFNIKFGSYWVRHAALVAEVTNDGLIGIDFLSQHGVTLNFSTKTISFHGEDLEAQCNRTQEKACRIAVTESITIPAGTRKIVQAKSSKP